MECLESLPNIAPRCMNYLHPRNLFKIDTKNDALENVFPFKYGNFWYLYC